MDADGIQIHVFLTLRSDGNAVSHSQRFLFGRSQAITLRGTWAVRNQKLIFHIGESSQPEVVPIGSRKLGRILSVDATQCRYQEVETNETCIVTRVADASLPDR